uniref:Sister chromatid cohesion protein DCC1 n=1 Tax=Parastrongyloides trichosuri TaxID=131310 RepID=A0A0N4ZY87_PARTI
MDAFVTRTPGSRKRRIYSQSSTPGTQLLSQSSILNDTIEGPQNDIFVNSIHPSKDVPDELVPFLDGILRTEYVDRVTANNVECELSNVLSLLELGNEAETTIHGVQQIVFDEDMANDRYKLMEIDNNLLEYFTNPEREVIFRGGLEDELILCTDDKTFTVKEHNTTRTYLLFPEIKDVDYFNENNRKILHKTISQGVLKNILVLEEKKFPDIKKIEEYFKNNQIDTINQDTSEYVNQKRMITYQDLLNDIQISEKQLIEVLDKVPVFQDNNIYHWISDTYQEQLFNILINAFDDSRYKELTIDTINFDLLKECLPSHVKNGVIEWFLKNYCEKDDNTLSYLLIKDKFIIRCVKQLLRNIKSTKLETFKVLMSEILPVGLDFDVKKHIIGLAAIKTSVTGDVIYFIDINSLSTNVKTRIKQLFVLAEKWDCKDIQAFLIDICGDIKGCDEALIKYCRSVKTKESRVYVGMKLKMTAECNLGNILKLILAIILPPIGVFLDRGCDLNLLINIVLTLLGYIPGVIHAIWVIFFSA